jgi:hypothetical protein
LVTDGLTGSGLTAELAGSGLAAGAVASAELTGGELATARLAVSRLATARLTTAATGSATAAAAALGVQPVVEAAGPPAAVRYAAAYARAKVWHVALREQMLADLTRDELADDSAVVEEIAPEHQTQMRRILDGRWDEFAAAPAAEPTTETIAAAYARAAAELVREASPDAVAEAAYAGLHSRASVWHWARPHDWRSWEECLASCAFGEPIVLAAMGSLGMQGQLASLGGSSIDGSRYRSRASG